MTDIVGSTEQASTLGDAAWRELVQLHHQLVRRALRRHGGRELDTAGDGFFAIFDAPAAAVICALEVATEVRELGIEIRAGVHVGEVEQTHQKVTGLAVPIAARIMSLAGPGEVLVSGTARELATGAGLGFDDRGVHELKGVPGEWHVYAAQGTAPATSGADLAGRRAAAVRRAQARPVWQRRPRLVAALVVGLALVVTTAGLLVWQPWLPPALSAIDENAVGVIDGQRRVITGSIKVDQRPGGLAVTEDAVWVTNTGSNTVTLVDPATRSVRRVIDVGAAPLGIAVAAGSVWVANSGARTVSRINAASARVVDTITVGNGPVAVAATADSIWVANLSDSTIVRLDGASGEVEETIPVAAGPIALAADESGIWVASADAAAVTHLDPSSGVTLAAPIPLPARPTAIAAGSGSVWVASADGSVTRIDPQADRVTATIDVGGALSAIAPAGESVWVADRAGYVYQLDAANPADSPTRIATTASPEVLAPGAGEIWVGARASAASHRGGTLRHAFYFRPPLDPASATFTGPGSYLQLLADGLVGYRRVGGAAGSALLPNLATAIPRPTNGGRTYTFQLRTEPTYATGEPVRPADFRRAIERSFQVGDGFNDEAAGNHYFTSIAGTEACATPERTAVEQCNLSSGIVTDDAARTVTFHLTEPDPDFLYKLALPLAYPVPDGVPMNEHIDRGFPGTGPYIMAEHSETELRLTRNPRFTVWDSDVRPDGFPDEVIFMAVDDPTEAVAMVERGDADVTPLRYDNEVPAELFARLRNQLTGQLHFASSTVTTITFNTQIAPFDDLRVRQAVSMAIDRAHIAELHGGALAVSVTCQVLPPGWPGYQPYCPYTTHPDPGGRWQAPNLDAARQLVAESGTAGAEVVVGPVRARQTATRDYLVSVLRDLGYDASADPATDDDSVFAATFDDNRVAVGIWEWLPTYLAPTEFLGALTCDGSYGLTNNCDEEFDALVAEARALQATDAAAAAARWAEADRWVIDQALWAPLYNEGTDFLAARVGNYQFHPAYDLLLDQLWVQ